MITHTIESYWIPSQKKTKSKLQILKKCQNFEFLNFETGITGDTLKLLDKMCKYEIDPMSIVEDTERTRFCPQTDKWYQYTPLSTSLKRGYNKTIPITTHVTRWGGIGNSVHPHRVMISSFWRLSLICLNPSLIREISYFFSTFPSIQQFSFALINYIKKWGKVYLTVAAAEDFSDHSWYG